MHTNRAKLLELGAAARLDMLRAEMEQLLKDFPSLRPAVTKRTATATPNGHAKKTKVVTKHYSAQQRKDISARMKRYWQAQREKKNQPLAETPATSEGTPEPVPVVGVE
jgi:hypothetical protein